MEREKIIERLKEASRKNEGVTITVRTWQYETREIPLVITGVRENMTGKHWYTWEVTKDKETGRDVVLDTFQGADTMGNRCVIMETYLVDNIEGFVMTSDTDVEGDGYKVGGKKEDI